MKNPFPLFLTCLFLPLCADAEELYQHHWYYSTGWGLVQAWPYLHLNGGGRVQYDNWGVDASIVGAVTYHPHHAGAFCAPSFKVLYYPDPSPETEEYFGIGFDCAGVLAHIQAPQKEENYNLQSLCSRSMHPCVSWGREYPSQGGRKFWDVTLLVYTYGPEKGEYPKPYLPSVRISWGQMF